MVFRWRNWYLPALAVLFTALPVAVYAATGMWTLRQTNWWWLLPICWTAAFLLSMLWRSQVAGSAVQEAELPLHWTPRDAEAWDVIRQQQELVTSIAPERMLEPQFYLDIATEMAKKIARLYHPRSNDPLGSLTVLEVMAVAHLACEDLERWARDNVPAIHMLTVNQWRKLATAPSWFSKGANVTWALRIAMNPANLARYLASKLTVGPTSKQVQANLLAWSYLVYVRQVGFYLVEMNSGRLRGGADKYRQAMSAAEPATGAADATVATERASPSAEAAPAPLTIAVVGQVNAGKSSVINALLGERRSATDVLPLTDDVTQFRLQLPDTGEQLTLLDTPGYGGDALLPRQRKGIRRACRDAHLIFLVLHATHPARKSDLQLLDELQDWYSEKPELRPPDVLAILTHIDQLSPVTQWDPPYNWQEPVHAKELSIAGAVEYNAEQLQTHVASIVPVCVGEDESRQFGVDQWLMPTVVALVGNARACSLIRTLRQDVARGQVRRVFFQLRNMGVQLLNVRRQAGEAEGDYGP